jgi:hypothetical protein
MNSKSILRVLFQAPLALCVIAQPLSAATFGKFTYTVVGNSITITGYPDTAVGALAIPATIAGKPVTSIGDRAFTHCSGLTSVSIPNRVTSIGKAAFWSCSGLTRVSIPNSVASIWDGAFFGCSGLPRVSIPKHVTFIGEGAFDFCGSLTRADFLGNAPSMDSYVFSHCDSGFTVYYLKGKTGFTSPTWNGYPAVAVELAPEINVQQPVGSNLVDGTAKKSFGTVRIGKTSAAKTFTIKNTGNADLKGLAITKNGAHAKDFIVTAPNRKSIAPGTGTTFKVTFKPSATKTRNAAIHIKSNDSNENPFDIKLTGLGADH